MEKLTLVTYQLFSALDPKDAIPSDLKGTPTSFGSIAATVTRFLLFLVGAIGVIMLIVGGLRYILSGGNPQATKSAKDTILYAIVGIVVALLAYVVVNFVIARFS